LNIESLRRFGFDERAAFGLSDTDGLFPARIAEQQKDLYHVVSEFGLQTARVTGKFQYSAQRTVDFPAVGDWVLIEPHPDLALIHRVLPRKSVLERKIAGMTSEGQIIASNLDVIFLCMSMNENFNLRRLERYLAMAWSSGAIPCVVLTKSDLTEDPRRYLRGTMEVAIGADVLVCSDLAEDGYSELDRYLKAGRTYAFIGSSGVGKSTMVNHLMAEEVMETRAVREDDKGRHTTTSRQMFLTPSGAIVIDTPGMREIQLDSADLSQSFSDIEELGRECKFSDCTHTSEPHCAVLRAVEEGSLPFERLKNFRKLQRELAYQEQRAKYAAIEASRWNKRS
jgi:ribosome biogenesis GTPase